MEFKGTKGEWKTGLFPNLNHPHRTVLTKEGNLEICTINLDTAEVRANAKLIAAAPDLLKACIHALEMCEDRVTPTENDLTIMAGRLKAPINKALN